MLNIRNGIQVAILASIFWALLPACDSISNRTDEILLNCGELPDTGFQFLIINGWKESPFEAVLVRDSRARPLRVNQEGCVEIAKGQIGKVFARSGNDGVQVDLVKQIDTKLFRLSAKQNLENKRVLFACPVDQAVTSGSYLLSRQEISSDRPHAQSHYFRLISNSKTALEVELNDLNASFDLAKAGLKDGVYDIELLAIDYFDQALGLKPHLSHCKLQIDTAAPVVESSLSNLPHYFGDEDTKVIVQDESFEIFVEDSSPTQLFVCLRPRSSELSPKTECDESAFSLSSGFIRAPQQGAWDIDFYAVDFAGNRSATMSKSLAVFQDRAVESTRRALLLARSKALLGQDSVATNLMIDAFDEFDAYPLLGERRSLKSDMIQTALDVDGQVMSSSSVRFQGTPEQLLTSPVDSGFALLTKEKSLVWSVGTDWNSVWQMDDVIDAEYNANGDLAVLYSDGRVKWLSREGNILNLVQLDEAISSLIEHRRMNGRIRQAPNDKYFAIITATETRLFDANAEPVMKWQYPPQTQVRGPDFQFSKAGDFAVFKYRKQMESIDLRSDSLNVTKYPIDEACAITSIAVADQGDVYLVNTNDGPHSSSDPDYQTCRGLNVWSQGINPSLRNNLSLDYELSDEFSNSLEVHYQRSPQPSLLLFDKYTPYLAYFTIDQEGRLTRQVNIASDKNEALSSYQVSEDGGFIVIETSDNLQIRPFAVTSELALSYRSLKKVQGQSYRYQINSQNELIVATDGHVQRVRLGDSILGKRLIYAQTVELNEKLYTADPRNQPWIAFNDQLLSKDSSGTASLAIFNRLQMQLEILDMDFTQLDQLQIPFIPTALSYYDGRVYFSNLNQQIFSWHLGERTYSLLAENTGLVVDIVATHNGLVITSHQANDRPHLLQVELYSPLPYGKAYEKNELLARDVLSLPVTSKDQRFLVYQAEADLGSAELSIFDCVKGEIVFNKTFENSQGNYSIISHVNNILILGFSNSQHWELVFDIRGDRPVEIDLDLSAYNYLRDLVLISSTEILVQDSDKVFRRSLYESGLGSLQEANVQSLGLVNQNLIYFHSMSGSFLLRKLGDPDFDLSVQVGSHLFAVQDLGQNGFYVLQGNVFDPYISRRTLKRYSLTPSEVQAAFQRWGKVHRLD